MNSLLLSTAYFGPIQYYSKFLNYEEIYIEQFEHFNKQTYRNRCVILGGNGPIQLVVPVVKGRGRKILIKDLEVSYDTNWQRNHWRTIFSAYSSSPFFEYYKDDIQYFFETRQKFLFDLNLNIHEIICGLLEIENNTMLTSDFEKAPDGTVNLRETITPKITTEADLKFQPQKYTQVFSDKLGFIANLSILDLLFNEGPNSYSVLQASVAR